MPDLVVPTGFLGDQDGNAIDDGVNAAAGGALENGRLYVQSGVARGTGELVHYGRQERGALS